MSKAFTREEDDASEQPIRVRPLSILPPGTRNYMTPNGAQNLRNERERLAQVERPRIVKMPDEIERKRRLQILDQRVQRLEQSMDSAVIVTPPAAPDDVVRFGATVTIREAGGGEMRYRIVGVDETDSERDWVSWLSPIAKALLKARIGQRIRFKFPAGEKELEIVSIAYE